MRKKNEIMPNNNEKCVNFFDDIFARLVTISLTSGISYQEHCEIKTILDGINIGYIFCESLEEFKKRDTETRGEYFAFIHNGKFDSQNKPIYIVYSSYNLPPFCFDLTRIRSSTS